MTIVTGGLGGPRSHLVVGGLADLGTVPRLVGGVGASTVTANDLVYDALTAEAELVDLASTAIADSTSTLLEPVTVITWAERTGLTLTAEARLYGLSYTERRLDDAETAATVPEVTPATTGRFATQTGQDGRYTVSHGEAGTIGTETEEADDAGQ